MRASPRHGRLTPIADAILRWDIDRVGPQGDMHVGGNQFFLASDFATVRAQSMKSCAAGPMDRFFNVTIPTCQGRSTTSTGKTLSENRSALNRSTEPDSAETKRLVASKLTRWWAD